ncbi:hypothetical protein B0H17DRAFT_1148844 [Mycena rosella]|uniref:Uncharacterized protein n=1 Tax=Mycena rosella TaxID=1033263 RepID=A0AAD7C6K6_MYCRO|nr:hypothetical protein B0H17DRAFT_1148844 [Mycena rosella]
MGSVELSWMLLQWGERSTWWRKRGAARCLSSFDHPHSQRTANAQQPKIVSLGTPRTGLAFSAIPGLLSHLTLHVMQLRPIYRIGYKRTKAVTADQDPGISGSTESRVKGGEEDTSDIIIYHERKENKDTNYTDEDEGDWRGPAEITAFSQLGAKLGRNIGIRSGHEDLGECGARVTDNQQLTQAPKTSNRQSRINPEADTGLERPGDGVRTSLSKSDHNRKFTQQNWKLSTCSISFRLMVWYSRIRPSSRKVSGLLDAVVASRGPTPDSSPTSSSLFKRLQEIIFTHL